MSLGNMPESKNVPITILPSVWRQRLHVKLAEESVSSSDESYHQPKHVPSSRHTSLPNILDGLGGHRASCAVDKRAIELVDPADRIRSPSLKVLHSQFSVVRRSSVVEVMTEDSSSDDQSLPGEMKSSGNSDGGVQRDQEILLSGSGSASLGTDQDSGLADDLKDGRLEGSGLSGPKIVSPESQVGV